MNCNWTGKLQVTLFLLIFPERNFARTVSKPPPSYSYLDLISNKHLIKQLRILSVYFHLPPSYRKLPLKFCWVGRAFSDVFISFHYVVWRFCFLVTVLRWCENKRWEPSGLRMVRNFCISFIYVLKDWLKCFKYKIT